MKKNRFVALVVAVAFVLAAGALYAASAGTPPAAPTACANGGKMAPVTIDHAKHAAVSCTTCHHKGEGQKCSTCHKADDIAGGAPSFKNAAHKVCKDCHTKQGKGPKACGECHKR